jgi:holo-[acyl-carrier protein] synthase
MITGIGIDIVHVNRIEKWLEKSGLLKRFFHPDELAFALSRGKGAAKSLAARFAAKEALGKALGTGLANIALKDIAVLNAHNGRPEIVLFDTAKKAVKKSGAKRVHVSLTHERENAAAMIVLEAGAAETTEG